jgi:hypothetical protein
VASWTLHTARVIRAAACAWALLESVICIASSRAP